MDYYLHGKNFILENNIIEPYNIIDINDFLTFIRGYIEFNYKIIMPQKDNENNIAKLLLYFRKIDKKLVDYFINILNNQLHIELSLIIKPCQYNKIKYNYKIILEDIYVYKFLSHIYNKKVDKNEIDEYLYNCYIILANYKSLIYDSDTENIYYILPKCIIKMINKSAIIPKNINVSNNYYEISIIKRYKQISDKIIIYDTGLQIIPPFGFYIEILPVSNLILQGYIIHNSEIIDNTYYKKNNTLLITLIKLDKEMNDIKLPMICCKIILHEIINYELHIH